MTRGKDYEKLLELIGDYCFRGDHTKNGSECCVQCKYNNNGNCAEMFLDRLFKHAYLVGEADGICETIESYDTGNFTTTMELYWDAVNRKARNLALSNEVEWLQQFLDGDITKEEAQEELELLEGLLGIEKEN